MAFAKLHQQAAGHPITQRARTVPQPATARHQHRRWCITQAQPQPQQQQQQQQQQQDMAADTAAPVAPPPPTQPAVDATSNSAASGFLATAEQQAGAFGALSITSLAFGVVALAVPQLLLSVVLGVQPTPLDLTFTRIAGGTMAISAAVEYSLQDAVSAGHLKSATYQRLMVAVVAKSSLYLTACLLSPELWNPLLAAVYPTAAAASIAINVATLRSAFAQAGAASFSEGLGSIWGFSTPKKPASWGYSVAVVLYAATVAACYAPEAIFTGAAMTPAGLLLKRTWAPGFVLAAGACYVLKDAADRGRLGASTFVRLNQGLAAVEACYSVFFATALASGLAVADGSSWSNLGGSAALVLFFGWQALTAKK